MKRAPELMIWIVPLAIAGGVALAIAMHGQGGVLAWCVATACGVACLFSIVAGIQYARFGKSSASVNSAVHYFANWPSEMDVLFSGASSERRTSAVENLERLARDPKWQFRQDFVDALRYITGSKAEDPELVSVASRALAKLRTDEECDPPIQVDPDPQPRPKFVREPSASHPFASGEPTYEVLRLVLRDECGTVIFLRRNRTEQPFDGGEIIRQLEEGARRPFEERIRYATEQAKLNLARFPLQEEVVGRMMRRSTGREWLDILSEEELQLVATEPWFFALQEAIHTQSGTLRVHLWPLLLQSLAESKRGDIGQFLGAFGSELFRLKRQP